MFRSLLAIVVFGIMMPGCAPAPDQETAVRAVIEAAERAVEARDVSAAMALVSADYADTSGRERDGLRQLVRGWFALNPKIDLLVFIDSVEFPDSFRARVLVQVTSLTRGSRLALENDVFALELFSDEGTWRLQRAERIRK